VPIKNKTPGEFPGEETKSVLKYGHKELEDALAIFAGDVAKRFTKFVKPELNFYELDKTISDIGDSDVFVYLEDKNLIVNIESKVIDRTFCFKDLKRLGEKIFGRIDSSGKFKNGYLQKHEVRHEYLKIHSDLVLKSLGWPVKDISPKIVSIFVTQYAYWWTRFPPIKTEVNFVEIRTLDDYIKNLVGRL
jgi:hypothetical protein